MRRVVIPLIRLEAVRRILTYPEQPDLDPVIEKIDSAVVDDDHVTLLLTDDECDAAHRALAAFGGIEGKVSLIFSEALAVDDPPAWKP